MSHLLGLPTELLIAVCSYCDDKALYGFAVSCRRLNPLAEPLLYRRFDRPLTLDKCTKLALTLIRKPDLARLCEVFTFCTGMDLEREEDKFIAKNAQLSAADLETIKSAPAYHQLFVSPVDGSYRLGFGTLSASPLNGGGNERLRALLLLQCTNLKHLSLTTDWLRILEELCPRHLILQSLEALQIRGQWFPAEKHDASIDKLSSFPALRQLDFYGCDAYFEYQNTFNLGVAELRLHQCDLFVGDLCRLVAAPAALELFEYEWYAHECAEELMTSHGTLHILKKYTETLRKLKLSLIQVQSSFEVLHNAVFFSHFAAAADLTLFTKLEYLEVEYLAFLSDDKMDWQQVHLPEQLAAPLRDILPHSIQTVVLRRCLNYVRDHLLQFLRGDDLATTFPRLNKICVEMWSEYLESSWSVLTIAFAKRGIDLVVSQGTRSSWHLLGGIELEDCPYEDEYARECEWRNLVRSIEQI